MPETPEQIIKKLQKNGFYIVSTNGSHCKLRNDAAGRTVIVPIHSRELKKGTEESILKQAGLDHSAGGGKT